MLENLKLLKKDMERLIGQYVVLFLTTKYIVLVKRFVENELRKNKYALVKLHFMRSNDWFVKQIVIVY